MNYPDGQPYQREARPKNHQQTKKTNFGKRGMDLEDMLNQSNRWYLQHERAVIHKKPTPVQVVSVEYPKRSRAKITEAYYRRASTTDYNGIYKGRYIDFEAKQTEQVRSFPLHNFHDHQIEHMRLCYQQDGIIFVIMYFSKLDQAYLYPYRFLAEDWQACKTNRTSSIPLERIQDKGYSIPMKLQPRLDYLAVIDAHYDFKRDHREESEI